MTRGSVLLVDDEPKIRQALAKALRDEGHDVNATGSPREALRLVGERPFDLLVVDNLMPELSGLELIREVVGATGAAERPQILMMTAHATVQSAIEAMKLGALDYLQKPFEIDEFLVVAARAIELGRLRTHHDYLITERDEQFDHYGIVGRSRAIQEVVRKARLVAQSRSTVLIVGETGTGKELVARAIHDWSGQREMPLVRVNCAALPETLIESELFGHVRGAFTGAVANKKGRFALADGGTIFLDEIGVIAPTVQAKLLRVLAGTRVRAARIRALRAGGRPDHRGDEPRPATARGGRPVSGGSVLPAQRDPHRDADASRAARGYPVCSSSISSGVTRDAPASASTASHRDAMTLLMEAPWPGNVRELENAVERAVVLAPQPVIQERDVTLVSAAHRGRAGFPSLNLKQNLEWAERETVHRALDGARGVKKDAAEMMGISQRAMSYYVAKHKLGDGQD